MKRSYQKYKTAFGKLPIGTDFYWADKPTLYKKITDEVAVEYDRHEEKLTSRRHVFSEYAKVAIRKDYWLMDGRANLNVNNAIVLRTCESLSEAYRNLYDYGNDTCIVDVETKKVVYSMLGGK